MVTALIISIAVVAVVALLCFKGIKIHFNKTFTINDNRKFLTAEQTDLLEKRINTDKTDTGENNDKDKKSMGAPMDVVLGNIADIFGPEDKDDRGGNR